MGIIRLRPLAAVMLACCLMSMALLYPGPVMTEPTDATTGATGPPGKPSSAAKESPEQLCSSGRQYLMQGNYAAAILRFNGAIETDPRYAMAYYMRARARLKTGQTAEALEDFAKVVELKPEDKRLLAGALYGSGAIKTDRGLYNEALDELTRSIWLAPNEALTYKKRADAYAAMGMNKKAIDDYEKAISLSPTLRKLLEEKIGVLGNK